METNNKLREALMQIYDRVNSLDENCGVDPVEIRDIARAALSEPVHNCEVGTAEEQVKRMDAFCNAQKMEDFECQCPCYSNGHCNHLVWAQMPYEEKGGAK